jgi:hypothetical protein
MNTDIEYLELVERDLSDAAAREKALQAAPVRRRPRMSWGTAAAAIVPILVVAGLIGWVATGGSVNNASTAGGGKTLFAPATGRNPAIGDQSGPAMPSTTAAPSDNGVLAGAAGAGGAHVAQQVGDLSKIIRDGMITIEVPKDDFQKGFDTVTRIADNNGGFVLSSQTRGQRAGSLTLRIPAKRFDQAMIALRGIGLVQATSVSGKDVTAEFIDLHARLVIAKSRRTVLLGLMSHATTIGDTLTVQRQLDDVQLQIEQIQGQLNFIDDQVAESTIRVELHEKNAPHPQQQVTTVENPSLGTAWDRAVQGFLNVVSAVVIGLGYLIPLGLLALAAWLLTLAARRRRATS